MKRLGKFYIPKEFIDNHPDDVKRIMGECVIFRCELLYHRNEFEYYAESDYFDELQDGAYLPTYEWQIDKDGWIHFDLGVKKLA